MFDIFENYSESRFKHSKTEINDLLIIVNEIKLRLNT